MRCKSMLVGLLLGTGLTVGLGACHWLLGEVKVCERKTSTIFKSGGSAALEYDKKSGEILPDQTASVEVGVLGEKTETVCRWVKIEDLPRDLGVDAQPPDAGASEQ